ncbi:hypothetical protein M4I32_01810 [Microbacterium sp. LRZ72]|uniref:hypothetical protein n=1 Tax=Microbacterium sp. LRZ72 TaxID=2942481 RepID=UPI0029AC110E|nr:hypothetical protein [Microbacterium sp. LRZ72]MDX2375533.1 hypothetical protein [Microbacterium sp. LRZ72]
MTTSTPERSAALPTLSIREEPPALPARLHATLEPAAPALFRVRDRAGIIIGHLEAIDDPRGRRWRARRFQPLHRTFGDVGEFWEPGDAVVALQAG